MITEDYLMRQIEIIGRTLAKLIFNKESPEYIILDYQLLTQTDMIYNELLGLIDEGKINEAENLLFDKIDEELEENPDSKHCLEIAIDFYSRLNELSSNVLDEYGFEREEIEEGLREVSEIYGICII